MQITVTATSTDILSLIKTAWYDFSEIEKNRIKDKNSNNSFWVYLKNTGANSIFLENIYTATTTTSLEIVTTWDFSLDVYELSRLNLRVSTTPQTIIIIIT